MKFDQDFCGTCDMNSTLGSVVPLAMFFVWWSRKRKGNVQSLKLLDLQLYPKIFGLPSVVPFKWVCGGKKRQEDSFINFGHKEDFFESSIIATTGSSSNLQLWPERGLLRIFWRSTMYFFYTSNPIKSTDSKLSVVPKRHLGKLNLLQLVQNQDIMTWSRSSFLIWQIKPNTYW